MLEPPSVIPPGFVSAGLPMYLLTSLNRRKHEIQKHYHISSLHYVVSYADQLRVVTSRHRCHQLSPAVPLLYWVRGLRRHTKYLGCRYRFEAFWLGIHTGALFNMPLSASRGLIGCWFTIYSLFQLSPNYIRRTRKYRNKS